MSTKTTSESLLSDQEDDAMDWMNMPGHVAKRVRAALDKYEADRQRLLSENAAITERALPAEEALRLAMDYILAVRSRDIDHMQRIARTLEALRANPMAAKMLEE